MSQNSDTVLSHTWLWDCDGPNLNLCRFTGSLKHPDITDYTFPRVKAWPGTRALNRTPLSSVNPRTQRRVSGVTEGRTVDMLLKRRSENCTRMTSPLFIRFVLMQR